MFALRKSKIFILFLTGAFVVLSTNCFDNYYMGKYEDAPALGSVFKGGIVAYLLQEGDPGYDPLLPRGLIAAKKDQSKGASWGCMGKTVGATSNKVGGGKKNTDSILHATKEEDIAASICDELVHDGYDDWYLPSKEELNILFLNKDIIGGFSKDGYWSSTEDDENTAWSQLFKDGKQLLLPKKQTPRVRCVRSF